MFLALQTPDSAAAMPLSPIGDKMVTSVQELRTAASVDDVVLLQSIAKGDRVSFQTFYSRHSGRTLAVLRKLCRDSELADDLLQEVFLAVWRRAATFRVEQGDPLGWLYAVTRNKVVDYRRRRRGADSSLDDSRIEALPAASASCRDLRITLEQALAQLTQDQQSAVRMTYFSGYTYEETAARLEVPLGTLKSRLRSALRRLRDELGGFVR